MNKTFNEEALKALQELSYPELQILLKLIANEISTREKYPVEDWKYEVTNGDTRLGYAEWLEHKVAAEGGKV